MMKEVYDAGQTIVRKGDVANSMYIIKSGEVECVINDKVVRVLKKGDSFGEKAILMESTRSLDVIAKTESVCMSISIETLKNVIGENFRDVMYLNFIKLTFEKSKYFTRLNSSLIQQAYHTFSTYNYQKDKVVFPTGYIVNKKLIVIMEGSLYQVSRLLIPPGQYKSLNRRERNDFVRRKRIQKHQTKVTFCY